MLVDLREVYIQHTLLEKNQLLQHLFQISDTMGVAHWPEVDGECSRCRKCGMTCTV